MTALAPVAAKHIFYISCARIFIDNVSLGFESNDASYTHPQLSNDPGVVGILGKNDVNVLRCICLICGVEIYQLRSQVKNTHLQFLHTQTAALIRHLSKPNMCGIHRDRLSMVLGCERSKL
jgi:hypothetical protein